MANLVCNREPPPTRFSDITLQRNKAFKGLRNSYERAFEVFGIHFANRKAKFFRKLFHIVNLVDLSVVQKGSSEIFGIMLHRYHSYPTVLSSVHQESLCLNPEAR